MFCDDDNNCDYCENCVADNNFDYCENCDDESSLMIYLFRFYQNNILFSELEFGRCQG